MRRRSLVAFLMTIAFAILCAGDLLSAGARVCGAHPCCAKGVCKMMPKSGARFDRCGDDQTIAPQPPIMLTAIRAVGADVRSSSSAAIVVAAVSDGASFAVDRPPRG